MANESLEQLKVDVGILTMEECTKQESTRYSEIENNRAELPDFIRRGGHGVYYYLKTNVSEDKEQLYLLMRISKDLHFITVLIQVLLVLGLLGFVAALIFGQMG